MLEDALLVARHDIVADFRQRDRIAIGGHATDEEDGDDAAADQRGAVVTLRDEDVVDQGLHDPGGEAGGGGGYEQAGYGEGIVADIFAAVLGEDALQHGDDFTGLGLAAFGADAQNSIRRCIDLVRRRRKTPGILLEPLHAFAYGAGKN